MWRADKKSAVKIFLCFWPLMTFSSIYLLMPKAFGKSKYSMFIPIDINTNILSQDVEFLWGQDPFLKKPGYNIEKETSIPLHLNAVFVGDEKEKIAIINDIEIYEGSFIEGYLVKDIGKNFVILKKGHYLKELNLPTFEPKNIELEIQESNLRKPANKDQEND